MFTAGLGGATRHACVALTNGRDVLGVCEQERASRVRAAGFNPSGLPDEALDLLLERHGHRRHTISRHVIAEGDGTRDGVERIDHHLAHACAAYLSSPFSSATIVVCDHEAPNVSVWQGRGPDVKRVAIEWTGPGFADVYSRCAAALGLGGPAGALRMEALARLRYDRRDTLIDRLFETDAASLRVASNAERVIDDRLGGNHEPASRAGVAAALQTRLAEVFLEFLAAVRRQTDDADVCLGGSLFYHSSFNTAVKASQLFSRVFVPIDPGNAGLAVGTALYDAGTGPRAISPFLGPAYAADEVKQTLENCKLPCNWESDDRGIELAVQALLQGRLVAWFEGGMEWGPRSLGARCILANPFAPYVLENLNRFLKHREPWRGYALSGLEEAVGAYFLGPPDAPFMECDYRLRDARRFAHVLPAPDATLRIQTVGAKAPARFRQLLRAFGDATGLPFLVNTSFNGFHEPIVCSPRDAVRVFYGSGLDLLVLGEFVLAK